MQKSVIGVVATMFSLFPLAASAHQHATYIIGGTQYDIVIGSLNEPIAVDDKTGVDLRVTSGGHMEVAEDGDMEPAGGTAAIGLDESLKVELIAGDKKKTLELSPVWGKLGSYYATFYPTVATTLSYRVFGAINKTPVDLVFTCVPEGGTPVEEEEKEISAGVKQLLKGGSFGCPREKEALGFPEQSASIASLSALKTDKTPQIAIAIGAAALLLALMGLMRRRS